MADDKAARTPVADILIAAAQQLCDALDPLLPGFIPPATHVHNPLVYARAVHEAYLRRYADGSRRVIFLGMNPGPFGMAQTGVPFGEVAAVRDWMGLSGAVEQPARPNPLRPIEGFACRRAEVSGQRLWGLFAERFGSPDAFFAEHFVANYCPLVFDQDKRNLTPDKLPAARTAALHAACDRHLVALVQALSPEWVIGVGAWAEKRARIALDGQPLQIGRVLHPSPASPAANRGWAAQACAELVAQGVWNPSQS